MHKRHHTRSVFMSRYFSTMWLCVMMLVLASCAGTDSSERSPMPQPPAQEEQLGNLPPPPLPEPPESPQRTIKVGLLLPLSGDAAELGQSLYDAALLALSDKHQSIPAEKRNNTRVILIPKDTRGSAATGRVVVEEALKEGADIIVGPLFSHVLQAVKPIAARKGVNVVSFSNDRATAGGNVFLMSFLPEQQVDRIIRYAQSRGINAIAALLPNDAYGKIVAEVLYRSARDAGVKVSSVVYYPQGAGDVRAELQQVFKEKGAFQALLVPQGGARLNQIMDDMAASGIDHRDVVMLGSGQWDDASVSISSAVSGGWFASADPNRRKTFNAHFSRTYGYTPQRLATLSYDALALIATLAHAAPMSGDANAIYGSGALTDPAGFNGPVDGIFRFLPNGLSERGLAVMEVMPSGFSVIDPAPVSFRY